MLLPDVSTTPLIYILYILSPYFLQLVGNKSNASQKYKNSSELCEVILKETGVAMLPGSDFGFKTKKMLTRLSYTDFNGTEFFNNVKNYNSVDDDIIKRYAPNVVEGVSKLSNWAKNL